MEPPFLLAKVAECWCLPFFHFQSALVYHLCPCVQQYSVYVSLLIPLYLIFPLYFELFELFLLEVLELLELFVVFRIRISFCIVFSMSVIYIWGMSVYCLLLVKVVEHILDCFALLTLVVYLTGCFTFQFSLVPSTYLLDRKMKIALFFIYRLQVSVRRFKVGLEGIPSHLCYWHPVPNTKVMFKLTFIFYDL